jgi:hypothetical protein
MSSYVNRCEVCSKTPWIQPGFVHLGALTVGRCGCNPPRPEPEGKVYTQANWSEYIEALSKGNRLEIDSEIYWYSLEVLPPRYMRSRINTVDGVEVVADFGFCEGADIIVAYWQKGDRYFCQYTNRLSRGD